jgi:hypothetical protein
MLTNKKIIEENIFEKIKINQLAKLVELMQILRLVT